jgi:dynein heavy chain
MKNAVSRFIRVGVLDYDNGRRADWVLRNPGQAVAAGAQIMWARGTESAIRSPDPHVALQAWFAKSVAELGELTALVRSPLVPLARMVIVALVTTDVHARDIIETLIEDRVSDVNNFTWQQQLRYYYDRDVDEVTVKQANAVIPYGKEYEVCCCRYV